MKNIFRGIKTFTDAVRHDGWNNVLLGLGVDGKDPRLASRFKRRGHLSIHEIEALYEQDAIFARAINAFPEHATRRWISVKAPNGPADFERRVMEYTKNLEMKAKVYELARMARLEGGAAMILGADDGQDIKEPLNLQAVTTIRSLNVLSRYELFPGDIDRDPTSPNFREPAWYTFAGGISRSDQNRVHWSRVIRIKGIRATERTEQAYEGWGLSEGERIYEAIRQYGTSYDYTEALMKDLVQGVIKIKGLAEILAHDDGKIIKRLQMMSLVASAFNAVLLDEGEEYDRRTIQLNGIPEILLKAMDRVSAVTGIPVSILFGQMPTGFGNDDLASRTTFYDMISVYQENVLRRPIERILEAVLNADDGPTDGVEPEEWSHEFEPLESPSEAEKATTEKTKADTDVVLIQSGVIEPEEARTRLQNDPGCPYTLVEPEEDDEPVDPNSPDVATLVPDLAGVA